MTEIRLNVTVDGEFLGSEVWHQVDLQRDDTIYINAEIPSNLLPNEYGLDTSYHEYTTEDGETVWVPIRQVPYPEYCEECFVKIPEGTPYFEFRGKVWDRRIANDPIFRPLYRFCSEECRDNFKESSMRRRYDDAPPVLEVRLSYEKYDRFASVFVDGIPVYTVLLDSEDTNILEHQPGSLPFINLKMPLSEYGVFAKVWGPGT